MQVRIAEVDLNGMFDRGSIVFIGGVNGSN
jgi:hypothetical protein